jgi:hypothetical protein
MRWGGEGQLEPKHFVEFCVQCKQRLRNEGLTPDTVMIGTSAWSRDEERLKDKAYKHKVEGLTRDLTHAGLLCKVLDQALEGAFEAAAVGYAFHEMQKLAGSEQLPKLAGVIGSGGGSVQFMHSMKYRTLS